MPRTSKSQLQPLVRGHKGGGAIKGKTHGARALQKQIRAGQLRGNTLEGKSYYAITGALFALAESKLGREPNAIEVMAIETVAETELCRRVIFKWFIDQECKGRDRPYRQDKEPLSYIPRNYFDFLRAHDKALKGLAQLLSTTPARLESSISALDALRKPIEPVEAANAEAKGDE